MKYIFEYGNVQKKVALGEMNKISWIFLEVWIYLFISVPRRLNKRFMLERRRMQVTYRKCYRP
jgi:hypothetical protein